MWKTCLVIYGVIGISVISGCQRKDDQPQSCEVAVTNTYLASAVSDITDGKVEVFCLMPPGMCPGHFDMSPDQIRRLLNSRALFRFDFQSGMDDNLRRTATPIISVQGVPGMSIPDTYLRTCRQILSELTKYDIIDRSTAQANLIRLNTELAETTRRIREQIKCTDLPGTKVLASCHQAEFARWLGLDVAATFKSIDAMTPGDIETCLKAGRTEGISMVIANLQEGTELPARLAHQLNSKLVVFSNFPDTSSGSTGAFERLLQSNVNSLLKSMDQP